LADRKPEFGGNFNRRWARIKGEFYREKSQYDEIRKKGFELGKPEEKVDRSQFHRAAVSKQRGSRMADLFEKWLKQSPFN
jgi:hypothetical protein